MERSPVPKVVAACFIAGVVIVTLFSWGGLILGLSVYLLALWDA